MKNVIVFAKDPFDNTLWTEVETNDVLATLEEKLGKWPEHARLYHGQVSEETDVTPQTAEDIETLKHLEGVFYVVEYPEDPITIIIAVGVAVAAAYVLVSNIPKPAVQRSDTASSPNNELSQRTNTARLNGRIPDIYGQVRSTPDLIALPYTVFESNIEIEYAYMCVGRGSYDITDIRDGTTPLMDIQGAKCAVFGPYTSPNAGSPQFTIGGSITEPVLAVKKSNSVNGQTLPPPGQTDLIGPAIGWADQITVAGGAVEWGFTSVIPYYGYVGNAFAYPDYFVPGDSITISASGHYFIEPVNGKYSLDGTYTIASVGPNYVTFVNPGAVNANWNYLNTASYAANQDSMNIHLNTRSVSGFIGYFVCDDPETTHLYFNFVAPNGLYRDDGTTQTALTIALTIQVKFLDANGNETGAVLTDSVSLIGSSANKDQVALTRKVYLRSTSPSTGRCKVMCWRTTAKQTGSGTNVQDVKWRDLYFVKTISQTHFGDVTTIQVATKATTGALSVKERKLNCLAYRKIPTRVTGTTFSSNQTTLSAADIFTAIATDAKLGRRALAELDLDNIYNTIAEVQSYFGTGYAIQFSYTFDKANMSAEEMLAIVAHAVFCVAYRRGNMLRLSFERETTNSRLMFNHRNKLPGSETRTYTFGPANEYDSVELEYVNPNDYDSSITKFIPLDRSGAKAQKIEVPGVRNDLQAYFHAWRAYQKILYARTSIDFDALQEADLLIRNDRILVTNNTKAPTGLEGEVLSQNVLTLTLSQTLPTTLSATAYNIFLQLPNGYVDSIPCTPTAGGNTVLLSRAPTASLNLLEDGAARCIYNIAAAETSEFFWDTSAALNTWLLNELTKSDTAEGIQLTSTGTDPMFRSPDNLNFYGGNYTKVRARIKRTAGSGWDGKIFYSVAGGHGESASYYSQTAASSPSVGTWVTVEWDMSSLTLGGSDWITNFIRQVRIDLGNTSSDVFVVDWIMFTSNLNEPFMVTEISPGEGLTTKVSAINYDRRYYIHDQDYKTGNIT